MNIFDQKEREAAEEADALEEARVEREAVTWAEEEAVRASLRPAMAYPPLSPYIFADERSQRRTELEAAHYGKLDDYAAWQDEAVGAERRFR